MTYHGKKVVILGLAKSGTAVAKLLHHLGAEVIVNDAKEEEKCIEKKELESWGIHVICGGHPENIIHSQIDLVVKNPGIPYSIHPIMEAKRLDIPIITEVEIAYQLAKAPIIGITGSNGKTTTTTLIGKMLQQADKDAIIAGNIGTVVSEKAFKTTEEQILVTELSSFQLKGTISFKPHISILLNIYPAHLDYHQTLEDYIASKANIFRNQTEEDYAILNANCKECVKLSEQIHSNIFLFSTSGSVERGAYIENGKLFWRNGQKALEVISVAEMFLKGAHLENALAATIASILMGADMEPIRQVLREFKGVEHRLEYVRKTTNGAVFYNDSKATNPQATMNALTSFNTPVILIAGGLDRGIDFHELIDPFKKHVKAIVTLGETSEKLLSVAELAGIEWRYTVDNVTDAVHKAYAISKEGDVVLLSPACASWDMFSSFEERGSMFKEVVHKLN